MTLGLKFGINWVSTHIDWAFPCVWRSWQETHVVDNSFKTVNLKEIFNDLNQCHISVIVTKLLDISFMILTAMISLQRTVSLVESSNVLQCATRSNHVCTILFSFSFKRFTKFRALISGFQFNFKIEGTCVDSSFFVSMNN